MTAPTSGQWAALVVDELAGVVGPTELAGTVQVDVTGTAGGDRSVWAVVDGGRLAGAGAGPAETPDATLTLSGADAEAVRSGDLDPAVAFMQGRLKVAGDMGLVLGLLALAATAAATAARDRLAATGTT